MCQEKTMSSNPLAPNPETNIDNPGIEEPDYEETVEDPDSGQLPEDEPDDEDEEAKDEPWRA
jgi:hypothetical protein